MHTAWQNLQSGRLQQAGSIYMDVLKVQPNNIEALSLCSNIAHKLGKPSLARELLEKAINFYPDRADLHSNLGYVLNDLRNPDLALKHLNLALAINQNYPDAYINRANALRIQGRIEDALSDYRKAIELMPENMLAQANYIYTLNFSSKASPNKVFREHCIFAETLEANTAGRRSSFARNKYDPSRKIRIGYISPDFRTHSVAYFIEPVIKNHDKKCFSIFCYYNHHLYDNTTKAIKEACDNFRDTANLDDNQLVNVIKNDRIDILVDLAGYTGNNRASVLAYQPAPLQVSWLGYPNTSGLSSINYRITDEIADPAGLSDKIHTEKLIRLQDGFLCYKPPQDAPLVARSPHKANGYITFGSFNNLAKTNPDVLEAWATIMSNVKDSNLMLKCAGLNNTIAASDIVSFFETKGINAGRIHTFGNTPSRHEHLEKYSKIDIALDPFPYCGTTTTCEALWMGVPVVTLEGLVHRARVGSSLLNQIGLNELVGESTNQYMEIAIKLAAQPKKINSIRESLRDRMTRSSLTNAKEFTSKLESAYKLIWSEWCENNSY